MASVFWDSEGVLMIDYLERGKIITGVYYAELIKKIRSAIKEKRRGKLSHGVLLHHDNAPGHTSAIAMATIRESAFKLLSHHHIRQTWLRVTTMCSDPSRIHFVDKDLAVTRISSMR